MMDFVLVLHTHVPFVMGHGRWPHGSDWLMEAAVDSYLPLLDAFDTLRAEGVDAPVTLGVTPVLAAQLSMPAFRGELRAFFAQRLAACDDADREFAASGDEQLRSVVRFWRERYVRGAAQFDAIGGDIVGELRRLEAAGRIELMSSAATHAFLPLLARDESVRLQLIAGRAEHMRLFGHAAAGCWLPECAYRPRGPWAPGALGPSVDSRAGLETHLESAGYRFVVIDSHLASAGQPLEAYGAASPARVDAGRRSPYGDYTIGGGRRAVRALVRDPQSSRQVWSRDDGYPGEGGYLEFHKIRFPGGLKLWEVTGPGVSLGDKKPFDPRRARDLARGHAEHFAGLLNGIAHGSGQSRDGVIVAPFDTELLGHWWFEGPDFLADVYRALSTSDRVRPTSAAAHVGGTAGATALDLPAGSWGRGGDFSMWLNEQTAWMWTRLWGIEERFWNIAPSALRIPEAHPILEQAARELLLAQSSDWQFIISTGEVADYGERRFRLHADAVDSLVSALEIGEDLEDAARLAGELGERDGLFTDLLAAVASALEPAQPSAQPSAPAPAAARHEPAAV